MAKRGDPERWAEIHERIGRLGVELLTHGGEITDMKFTMSMRSEKHPNGMILVDGRLPDDLMAEAISKELDSLEGNGPRVSTVDEFRELIAVLEAAPQPQPQADLDLNSKPNLNLTGILRPEQRNEFGTLVVAQTLVFNALIKEVVRDWNLAFQIPPRKWEEIIAGAFDREGFDEVTLTPSSNDHGRDVIAIKKGIGSIKILSSVKAYNPRLLVGYDDIRALLGVMTGERDTSKGIIVTTSDFPPNVMKDPNIAPFIPTRLELLNGTKLRDWLRQLSEQA